MVRDKSQTPRLTVCAFSACAVADRRKTLQELVRQHGLGGARCVSVLEPGSYQLLQVEAPDVDATELKAAVRWRVKELIDFHIDDAAIDVFEMPGSGPRARYMYAVAARNPLIMQRVELLQGVGLNVEIIDITELALRNIAQLLPEDENGVALLQLGAGEGLITLTRQATLYLARNLDVGALQLGSFGAGNGNLALAPQAGREAAFETILLEVQRSFDYYESNFGQAPIKNLIIGPLAEPQDELAEYAAAHLGVKARTLDLNTILNSRAPLDLALQANCISTIGAALRLEEKTL